MVCWLGVCWLGVGCPRPNPAQRHCRFIHTATYPLPPPPHYRTFLSQLSLPPRRHGFSRRGCLWTVLHFLTGWLAVLSFAAWFLILAAKLEGHLSGIPWSNVSAPLYVTTLPTAGHSHTTSLLHICTTRHRTQACTLYASTSTLTLHINTHTARTHTSLTVLLSGGWLCLPATEWREVPMRPLCFEWLSPLSLHTFPLAAGSEVCSGACTPLLSSPGWSQM